MYKRVSVKASESAEPQVIFVEGDATVADILDNLNMGTDKTVPYVDGEQVDLHYSPESESTIVLAPRKYASGWWPK